MSEHLKPSLTLLCKLGSIAVHAEEMLGPQGHAFDRQELLQRLQDPEIQEWLSAMGPLVPRKRTAEDVRLAAEKPRPKSRLKKS